MQRVFQQGRLGRYAGNPWMDTLKKMLYAFRLILSLAIRGRAMTTERVVIELTYEGEALEGEAVGIDDAIHVLKGFMEAYIHIANAEKSGATHNLTITAIRPGSAIFEIMAHATLESLEQISVALQAAPLPIVTPIIKNMFKYIELKKWLRGSEPAKVTVNQNNEFEFHDSDNNSVIVNQNTFNLHIDGKLDKPIRELTALLGKEGIDSGVFKMTDEDGQVLSQVVESADLAYFEDSAATVTTESSKRLLVDLALLNRYTNKGRLYTENREWVTFEYVGDEPDRLLNLFSTRQRHLWVDATVTEREDKSIKHIVIHHFTPAQNDMFDN